MVELKIFFQRLRDRPIDALVEQTVRFRIEVKVLLDRDLTDRIRDHSEIHRDLGNGVPMPEALLTVFACIRDVSRQGRLLGNASLPPLRLDELVEEYRQRRHNICRRATGVPRLQLAFTAAEDLVPMPAEQLVEHGGCACKRRAPGRTRSSGIWLLQSVL